MDPDVCKNIDFLHICKTLYCVYAPKTIYLQKRGNMRISKRAIESYPRPPGWQFSENISGPFFTKWQRYLQVEIQGYGDENFIKSFEVHCKIYGERYKSYVQDDLDEAFQQGEDFLKEFHFLQDSCNAKTYEDFVKECQEEEDMRAFIVDGMTELLRHKTT